MPLLDFFKSPNCLWMGVFLAVHPTPRFQCWSSPIQAYNSCWFSKLSVTATARRGIRQSEDLTKWLLLLFKPSCNTWRELAFCSSTLPANVPLRFLHLSVLQSYSINTTSYLILADPAFCITEVPDLSTYKAEDDRPRPRVCTDHLWGKEGFAWTQQSGCKNMHITILNMH